MNMEQVSNNCYAVVNEKNRVCDANSGLINVGGGMVIDTQIEGRHAAPGVFDQSPIGGEIDKRGQNAAMAIALLGIDHPFLAPGRFDIDAVFIERKNA